MFYKTIAFIFFITVFFFLLGCYARVRLFTNLYCAHLRMTTAVLAEKNEYMGWCFWKVPGYSHLSPSWHNCDDIQIGELIPFQITDNTCDDLEYQLNSNQKIVPFKIPLNLIK